MRLPQAPQLRRAAGGVMSENDVVSERAELVVDTSADQVHLIGADAEPVRLGNHPFVHHTGAGRVWAYDRKSSVGRLDRALDVAPAEGWSVKSMKDD
jgi:hypothetical protein